VILHAIMLFSLIISTKGRTQELGRLLQSLREQTLQDFEVIVSDQNEDDRLDGLLKDPAWAGRLVHLKSSAGLSRGRNLGLAQAKGELFSFPDDDCAYPPTFLESVAAFFRGHPEYGFFCGRSVDDDGEDSVSRHARESSRVRRESIHLQHIEFAFVVRRSALGSLRFDEQMGVGAVTPWQSDEGPDLTLRLMESGVAGYYDPGVAVWHPRPFSIYDEKAIDRSYRYACGHGYFLRKHRYPFGHLLYGTAKTIAGCGLGCLKLNKGRALYYWARLRGTWRGWLHPQPRRGDALAEQG
jgi:glycosyltransferase involved in cell wall biosynthesis